LLCALNWTVCEVIELVPGKVPGMPVVRGTRFLPDVMVNRYDLGGSVEKLGEGFPSLTADVIVWPNEFLHGNQ